MRVTNFSEAKAKKAAKKESLAAKKWSRIKPKPVAVKGVRVGKTGIVRLTGKRLENLRRKCFDRDVYHCRECYVRVSWGGETLCAEGPVGHMAHIKSRGAGGSDTLDNVRTLCPECHMKEHNAGGKPCPKREKLGNICGGTQT